METGFRDVESDLRNLEAVKRRMNAIDRRNKVMYGGHGVFPKKGEMDKLGNVGKMTGKKQVNF